MRKSLLDTNVLIAHWRRSRGGNPLERTREDAVAWADRLIDIEQTNAIVTPVYLEILCGVINRHEMDLTISYLDRFQVLDGGVITPEDWRKARRLAVRIPHIPRPRGLVDCLIKAIAIRLRYDVRTFDTGMPR